MVDELLPGSSAEGADATPDGRSGAAGRYATLTPREREVMAGVLEGLANKQIAARLGIALATVKVHRGRVMRKMAVESVAALVRQSQLLLTGDSVALRGPASGE